MTLNALIKEIKKMPSDKLEELSNFVHALGLPTKNSAKTQKKILSFGGMLGELNDKDYTDYKKHIAELRSQNFDRKIDLG